MKHQTTISKRKNKHAVLPVSLTDKMDRHLQKNNEAYFWVIFALTALISLLLYDPRISLTGDDSSYILDANSFLKDFHFPGAQAMLYKIALSPVAYVFGLSLFPLKMFSLLSMLGFMFFTFRAFHRNIPASILLPVLALVSVNSYVLYYASQTYAEAFFMLVLSLFILVFFRFIRKEERVPAGRGREFKLLLCLALSALSVALTRLVGFSIAIGVAGYFLFYRQWRKLALFLVCYAVLFAVYSLLKDWIWGNSELQFSGQGSILLNKNPYRVEEGREDLIGFLVRFWQNSDQYLSNGLFRIMGFNYQPGENSIFRMLLVYAGAAGGLCFAFRRNRYLFSTILVAGAFLAVSFVVLQVFWNQERLIIPAYPFILMSILACLYYLLSKGGGRRFQFIYPVFIAMLFISGLNDTLKAIPNARKLTDRYSGLTPDWQNYLKASEWAGKNLKDNELIACRKPSMSVIYGNGKPFYGISSVPTGDAAAFMREWSAFPDRYAAVPITDQTGRQFDVLRNFYRARAELGGRAFWILNRSDSLSSTLGRTGIAALALPKMQELSAQLNNNFGIFYADSLLNRLKEGGVTHIMTACLRVNPERKTGQTVSTVERYAFYIQEKYPDIYRLIYQEGGSENEPAQIYEINWPSADGFRASLRGGRAVKLFSIYLI
ncbi:MAG: hypothetical protein LBK58_07700 [Prevotellaceae bacterium]|jgi:hypothetical protein|nr:hypothetical protein [Prevotellaceae bacterium]